ncbi:MAG: hypothetical protein GY938_21445 [Ketobacter sp.]|nr:hypothetical protein [Ketobacter sp.]
MKKHGMAVILAVGALAVTACVKQVWTTTYASFDNDYSSSGTLLLTADSVLTVGFTEMSSNVGEHDGVFVANFDRDGQLQWETLIPGLQGHMSRLAGGRVLAVDQNGNSFLAWSNVGESRFQLFKVSAQGQLVASTEVPTVNLGYVDDVKVGPDGVVYVSSREGSRLHAFDNDGELLWDIAYDLPPAELPFYLHQFQVATLHVLSDGNLLLASGRYLKVISPEGSEIVSLTPEALGLQRFTKASVQGGTVWTVGVDDVNEGSEGTLYGLSANLDSFSSTPIGFVNGRVFLSAGEQRVCMVLGPDYLQGRSENYEVEQYDLLGEWLVSTSVPVSNSGYWAMQGVRAATSGCYVAESFSVSGISSSGRVSFVSQSGKVADVVKVADATVDDFAVDGNYVYQVGITGEYDGSFTAVSLAKHQRY